MSNDCFKICNIRKDTQFHFISSECYICGGHYIIKHDSRILHCHKVKFESCQYSALNSCKHNLHNILRKLHFYWVSWGEMSSQIIYLHMYKSIKSNMKKLWKEFPWVVNQRSPGETTGHTGTLFFIERLVQLSWFYTI